MNFIPCMLLLEILVASKIFVLGNSLSDSADCHHDDEHCESQDYTLRDEFSSNSKGVEGERRVKEGADNADLEQIAIKPGGPFDIDTSEWEEPATDDSAPLSDDTSDKPLQLVRPDPVNHKNLVLVEKNLKYLHHIDGAVAVVAVVGKFHSGKSFLLNQLMGKSGGFGVGSYVEPKTMGIWMWGEPIEVTKSNGNRLSIVFVDTEGFAASNVSESYDAKIFAVSALLSSYLLYNSVKIIDQGDIDYLELLARGTRLFALKSQIVQSSQTSEFNHDLLQFPPLMWVVQDFHLGHTKGETPRDWLLRLMASSSRDEEYAINLKGIFSKITCHTLFLPATKRELLMDLSQAEEKDLTEEYRSERDALKEDLIEGINAKEKNGRPISGPELASLLRILVEAANEGHMTQIPGRWEAYLDKLKTSAVHDCVTFYENDMTDFLKKHNNDAINSSELLLYHEGSCERSVQLLKQLLFELPNTTDQVSEKLLKIVSEKFDVTRELNEKLIIIKCVDTQRRSEVQLEDELSHLEFPIKAVKFNHILEELVDQSVLMYQEVLKDLRDSQSYGTYKDQLQDGLRRLSEAAVLRNTRALEEVLNRATSTAIENFIEMAQNKNRIPRAPGLFDDMIQSAKREASLVFERDASVAEGETIYKPFRDSLEIKLRSETDIIWKDNLELVELKCQSISTEAVNRFRDNSGPTKLVLPINASELDQKLKDEMDVSLKFYDQSLVEFRDLEPFSTIREATERVINKVCSQRRSENVDAFAKVVEGPLKTATKVIKLSVQHYNTEFSTYMFMKEVLMAHLDEGPPKKWSLELKEEIISKHISNTEELQEILISKRSWWSSLIGFWQWLIWRAKSLTVSFQERQRIE